VALKLASYRSGGLEGGVIPFLVALKEVSCRSQWPQVCQIPSSESFGSMHRKGG
jgi:hypothetical protein